VTEIKKEQPYNPLDKKNLGGSVAEALLSKPVGPLPPEEAFVGAGIYALYYIGPFPEYEYIARCNINDAYALPIYVGKAVPAGARKGGYGLGESPGTVLYKRLAEHAKSIEQTGNLQLADFRCRYLVVDDIWIPLGENLLIEVFQPLWNKFIDGFGNHDPGGGRYNQKNSPWDVIHPGRSFAAKLQSSEKTHDEWRAAISNFLGEKS